VIGTCLYRGQGFGNQLWVYAVVRAAAIRKKTDFAVFNSRFFKGKDFLDLDFGFSRDIHRKGPSKKIPYGFENVYKEFVSLHPKNKSDVSPFDPQIFSPKDYTFLEGPMQSEDYIVDFKEQISEWFKVPEQGFSGCVINLRGGEFKSSKDHFLTRKYYYDAIDEIRRIDASCEFLVVTDDIKLSKQYFPNFKVQSSGGVKIIANKYYFSPKSRLIGNDFAKIQNAQYLILSNSSFSWWGAWTNTVAKVVIAPKYWARHNISDGYWSQGDSLTREWIWLDKHGKFHSYDECKNELELYRQTSNLRSK
jgi:hypothetical protein